jgi:hypothetical protein
MLGFPALDCLPSTDVSTDERRCKYIQERTQEHQRQLWPSGPNVCSYLALMHGMQTQQQC